MNFSLIPWNIGPQPGPLQTRGKKIKGTLEIILIFLELLWWSWMMFLWKHCGILCSITNPGSSPDYQGCIHLWINGTSLWALPVKAVEKVRNIPTHSVHQISAAVMVQARRCWCLMSWRPLGEEWFLLLWASKIGCWRWWSLHRLLCISD